MPSFFNPYRRVQIGRGNLPHWHQERVLYFVTFRLKDSLPRVVLEDLRARRSSWLRQHPQPWDEATRAEYWERFGGQVSESLDQGHGDCLLAGRDVAELVESTLRHFDGQRYRLGAFTIAGNHVHALLGTLGNHRLPDILHSWKSYSAHQINRKLGRKGTLWQRESYDHIVRSPESLRRIEHYIRSHPGGEQRAETTGTLNPELPPRPELGEPPRPPLPPR